MTDMDTNFIRFKDTKVYQMICPSPRIVEKIEVLEEVLLKKGIIDAVTETTLLSSYHITYTKDNRDIMMVRPSKSDWSLKVYDWSIDIREILTLDLICEFEFGKDPGWHLMELNDITTEDLKRAFNKAVQTPPVEYLIQVPLTVIEVFYLKSPWLFQKYNQAVIEEVLEAYWEGNIAVIKSLSDRTESKSTIDIHSFIERWRALSSKDDKKLNAIKCHERMKFNQETFLLQIKQLIEMVEEQLDRYRETQNSIWYDTDLMESKERFYEQIEQIRETILLAGNFIQDLKTLPEKDHPPELSSKVSVVVPKKPVIESVFQKSRTDNREKEDPVYTETVETETNDWFEYLISSGGNSVREIPFRNKIEVLGAGYHGKIDIHDNRLRMLVDKIGKDSRMTGAFEIVIRLIIEDTNEQGYVSKEELRSSFSRVYQKDIEKDVLSSSKITTTFSFVLEQLKKSKLIKEYYLNNAYRIYWNFGCYIHI